MRLILLPKCSSSEFKSGESIVVAGQKREQGPVASRQMIRVLRESSDERGAVAVHATAAAAAACLSVFLSPAALPLFGHFIVRRPTCPPQPAIVRLITGRYRCRVRTSQKGENQNQDLRNYVTKKRVLLQVDPDCRLPKS